MFSRIYTLLSTLDQSCRVPITSEKTIQRSPLTNIYILTHVYKIEEERYWCHLNNFFRIITHLKNNCYKFGDVYRNFTLEIFRNTLYMDVCIKGRCSTKLNNQRL